MKIIVNNEAEATLIKNFLMAVGELGIIDLMEKEDKKYPEAEQLLDSAGYRILDEAMFWTEPSIKINSAEPELEFFGFGDADWIEGTCVSCGAETFGLSDGRAVTWDEYLYTLTDESKKTWRCETCQIKYREKQV